MHWQRQGSHTAACMYWGGCRTCWRVWDLSRSFSSTWSPLKNSPLLKNHSTMNIGLVVQITACWVSPVTTLKMFSCLWTSRAFGTSFCLTVLQSVGVWLPACYEVLRGLGLGAALLLVLCWCPSQPGRGPVTWVWKRGAYVRRQVAGVAIWESWDTRVLEVG
jgi:hypothetical protein